MRSVEKYLIFSYIVVTRHRAGTCGAGFDCNVLSSNRTLLGVQRELSLLVSMRGKVHGWRFRFSEEHPGQTCSYFECR